jgi:hypothetical protein
MQLLSSFELLVQPIIPSNLAKMLQLESVDPLVLQSYFLILSNVSSESVTAILEFTADTGGNSTFKGSQDGNFKPVSAFLDLTAAMPLSETNFEITTPSTAKATLALGAKSTATFLLQPDVIPVAKAIKDPQSRDLSFELRGAVEISVSRPQSLLVSPQTRGTFFKTASDTNMPLEVFAEQAYGLPTANSNFI